MQNKSVQNHTLLITSITRQLQINMIVVKKNLLSNNHIGCVLVSKLP